MSEYYDENGRLLDAQRQHDANMKVSAPTPAQVQMLKDYLAKQDGIRSLDPSSDAYDPISLAMARNPKLTREAAEEFARAFGF